MVLSLSHDQGCKHILWVMSWCYRVILLIVGCVTLLSTAAQAQEVEYDYRYYKFYDTEEESLVLLEGRISSRFSDIPVASSRSEYALRSLNFRYMGERGSERNIFGGAEIDYTTSRLLSGLRFSRLDDEGFGGNYLSTPLYRTRRYDMKDEYTPANSLGVALSGRRSLGRVSYFGYYKPDYHGVLLVNGWEYRYSARLSVGNDLYVKGVYGDMADLEEQLKKAQAQRFRIIATDGVFSMDGNVCPLDKIYELAQKYDALVMVDESHSAGVVGKTGHGVTERYDLRGKIEIITGTLGKAFGGSVGGFTTGKKEIIDLLRQRSRPYLFSNSIPPLIAAAGLKTFEILTRSNELQDRLHANTEYFITKMKAAGFDIKPTESAICAVMLYDARLSQEFAAALQEEGIYVTGFYYPVVPQGQARIRVQLSAAHTTEQLDRGIEAFIKVGKALKVLE